MPLGGVHHQIVEALRAIGLIAVLFVNVVPYLEKSELAVEEKYCTTGGSLDIS